MHWIISLSDFGIDNYKSVGIECNDYFINEIPGTKIYDLVQMLAEYDCLEKMYVELKTNFKSKFINDQTENIYMYFNENDT